MKTIYKTYVIFTVLGLSAVAPAHAQTPNPPPASTTQKGLSFGVAESSPDAVTGIVKLRCGSTDNGYTCNPYQGDMACHIKLPVLCFKDIAAPAPAQLKEAQYWSGGVVVPTPKIAASQFENIKAVNAYCRAEFGKGWRVASFHDGGGWGISAYGSVGDPKQRVWIDIKDKKNGTCWSR